MDDSVLSIIDGVVGLKGGLAAAAMRRRIVELIGDRIKASVPNLAALKYDLELLTLILNCIENVVNKKSPLDKKALALEIIGGLFPLTEQDKQTFSSNIDTLCAQRGVVKRVSRTKIAYRWVFGQKKSF